jgi:1-acyl-sn-glycerol-3-phosphate acyltransferase
VRKKIREEVKERVRLLDIPFNQLGLDPYGISRRHLSYFYSLLAYFYRDYFKVQVRGIENIPKQRGAMVIGNHSGGLPVDAGMVMASLFLEKDPPRLAHGMVEKFAQGWPLVSPWFSRLGQFTGLPEHAVRLLEDDRLVLVFPEGARGTGKLYQDRYKLVRFGTGFMRLALRTRSPIVPFAFVGGEEAFPTMYHARLLARLTGAPYWPVPPHIIPFPKPVTCGIYYGKPMRFKGNGTERDEVILEYVEQVKERISELIVQGLDELEIERPPHLAEAYQEETMGGEEA